MAGLSSWQIRSQPFKQLWCSKSYYFLHSFIKFLILCFSSLPIRDCIAFATPHFQAPLANIFLLTLFKSTIIQSFDFSTSFRHALKWDLELGAHTDILHFSFDRSSPPITSMMCNKYVWWNANMRPYGHNIPFLCPTCASVQSWGQTVKEKSGWIIQCANPDCGINTDRVQLQPRATVSGGKPENITVMPSTIKRTNGWLSFTVVDVKVTLA